MSTYPGVGATRESISLDEDELSDVEDEVFIRDGRNGFKFAEERGVKRPLMAPRRKISKPDFASRLKNRPPCRVLCVPCCYAFAALSIFLGLIMLVIILVSLFPLPLDKLKTWIAARHNNSDKIGKVLPCTDLNLTEVWSFNLPKLTTESPMRALDVNLDGIDDIIFGFGIGEDVFLPEQWFCPMFLGVKPPCQGGIVALDGVTGQPLWKQWLHHAVFTIFCSTDLTGDGIFDCVASGKGGVLCAINGHDGSIIWEFMNNKTSPIIDIYAGSFIPDQDGDKVNDIIASHTVQKGRSRFGYLLIISGKTGAEVVRVDTPHSSEIYYAPQLFTRFNGEKSILFGTGGQDSPGALYMVGLHDIGMKNINPFTIYVDPKKGVLSPVILVDITGDKIEDIVAAMYNSTVVAFDGITFKQLWNFTIENSETVSAPTPGYFNSDNVTDFLVKYQVGKGFPVYYYSKTLIIDGKTGKPIYTKPLIDTIGEQLNGLTIRMEGFGNDIFLYWMSDCKNYEENQDSYEFIPGSNIWQKTRSDLCELRFNSSKVTKLYSMNQYNEPPGILLYTSENHESVEYNNSRTPVEDLRGYLKEHPDFETIFKNTNPTLKVEENFKPFIKHNIRNMKPNNAKPGSNFRHRDDEQTLLKNFAQNANENIREEIQDQISNTNTEAEDKFEYDQPEVPWNPSPVDEMLDSQMDYDTYTDSDRDGVLGNKHMMSSNLMTNTNRDPRSKNPENQTDDDPTSMKKNLDDDTQAITPNDYKNIYAARNRLLHDLNELPSNILRETFDKNKALRLSRDSKLEQRDVEDQEGKDVEKKETKVELPETLWDLESEKEMEDRENGYYRGKRENKDEIKGIPKATSTGLLLKPLTISKTNTAIDLVFATYWLLPKTGAHILLTKDLDCIKQKMLNSASSKDNYQNLKKSALRDLFTKMCLEERGVVINEVKDETKDEDLNKSPYFSQISQLTLGQMTVYRMRLECRCDILLPQERCAQIQDQQIWSSYMGKFGDGYFKIR